MKTAQILLIDPSQKSREALTALLEDNGYRVLPVSDALTGLERLRSYPQSQLVILNLAISTEGDWENLASIRSAIATKSFPFIVLTSDPLSSVQLASLRGVERMSSLSDPALLLLMIDALLRVHIACEGCFSPQNDFSNEALFGATPKTTFIRNEVPIAMAG